MRFRSTAFRLAWLALLPIFTTHAAESANDSLPVTQTVSHISGSIMQSTAKLSALSAHSSQFTSSSVRAVADQPGDAEDIKAVCITSGSDMERCGATTVSDTVAASGCGDTDRYNAEAGAMDEPSSWCHGHAEPTYAHAPHVAICDVDDVGLAGCLEKYAASLVKHPAVAKRVYQFTRRGDDSRPITVLATAKQTEHDAEQMAAGNLRDAKP